MKDYGDFQFACPPGVGGAWFCEAARVAGFSASEKDFHTPFSSNGKMAPLKVSLVRHPWAWLGECFVHHSRGNDVGAFGVLSKTDIESFIEDYLNKMPGSVGKLFRMYDADTIMLIEDMPWSAIEFFHSLGCPIIKLEEIRQIPLRSSVEPPLDRSFRGRVMAAEKELCNHYDYI